MRGSLGRVHWVLPPPLFKGPLTERSQPVRQETKRVFAGPIMTAPVNGGRHVSFAMSAPVVEGIITPSLDVSKGDGVLHIGPGMVLEKGGEHSEARRNDPLAGEVSK